jgi:hypothetical protein
LLRLMVFLELIDDLRDEERKNKETDGKEDLE